VFKRYERKVLKTFSIIVYECNLVQPLSQTNETKLYIAAYESETMTYVYLKCELKTCLIPKKSCKFHRTSGVNIVDGRVVLTNK